MDNAQILAIYEETSRLTRQMLAAARENDWDLLVTHEKACAATLSPLISDKPAQPPSNDFQRRKAELISSILDDDAQIRMLVEPWLERLSGLIGSARQQSRLHQSYGAM
jgi:flagellar protein FliT